MGDRESEIRRIFEERFGDCGGMAVSRAPGRVNLIGEHTDYNDGFVLPMAIDFGVTVAGRPRGDRKISLFSADYNEFAFINPEEKFSASGPRWSQYIEGVARTFEEELGEELPGFDAVVTGNVPQGTGLSSSAALEVATGFFINEIHGLKVNPREIALFGQKAENNYLGVRCGIMDQFASALCRKNYALFLDCRTLEFEHVPLKLDNYIFLILNSRKSRGLVDSAYNERRRACEEGARLFGKWAPGVRALRDVSPEMFERYKDKLPAAVMRKCRHIVSENRRVLKAVECLKNGDLSEFGNLMWASHDSLRDNYEVSCAELDILNEISRTLEGVEGERMTGAGFGGCGVALVKTTDAEDFREELSRKYNERTGLVPEIYATGASGGAECERG